MTLAWPVWMLLPDWSFQGHPEEHVGTCQEHPSPGGHGHTLWPTTSLQGADQTSHGPDHNWPNWDRYSDCTEWGSSGVLCPIPIPRNQAQRMARRGEGPPSAHSNPTPAVKRADPQAQPRQPQPTDRWTDSAPSSSLREGSASSSATCDQAVAPSTGWASLANRRVSGAPLSEAPTDVGLVGRLLAAGCAPPLAHLLCVAELLKRRGRAGAGAVRGAESPHSRRSVFLLCFQGAHRILLCCSTWPKCALRCCALSLAVTPLRSPGK